MRKGNVDTFSDDLIADSLQITDYLKQAQGSRSSIVRLGIEEVLESYMKRYQGASPDVQSQVFSFSQFSEERVSSYLKGGQDGEE